METNKDTKSGLSLILAIIVVGFCYQLLRYIPISMKILDPISVPFNAILAGGIAYLILKDEMTDWYKHFSIKWVLIGFPFLLAASAIAGQVWKLVSGAQPVANDVNSVLTWSYVGTHVPFMIMGEELLCIAILYAAWKKLGLKFWQASLICAVLFAVWHLPAYSFNLLQVLVTIIPARLVLNYIFKKCNSIWVTWIVHLAFDTFTFLFVLLK